MIVLVYGSLPSDTLEVSQAICVDGVKTIDLTSLMSYLSENCKWLWNKLTLDSTLAFNVMRAFENTYGSVIISGNVPINDRILEDMASKDNVAILITSRQSYVNESGDLLPEVEKAYGWMDSEAVIKYYCGKRYEYLYDKLNTTRGKKAHIFLATDGEVDYDAIDYIALNCDKSTNYDVSPEKIIYETVLKYKEVLSMPNELESAIKSCMARLGYNPDNVDLGQSTEQSAEIEHKSQKTTKTPKREPIKAQPQQQTTSEVGEETQVLCKVVDGKMVLFIPEDVKMDTTVVGEGERLLTIAFKSPDFNSTALQVLNVFKKQPSVPQPEKKSVSTIVRVPIIFVDETDEDIEEVPNEDSELSKLIAQKSELDAAIKEARKNGNEDEVNALRKQRRAVRAKINALQ